MYRAFPFVLLLFALSICSTSAAQLEGHFSLSKTSYSAGEPIYLIFEVENRESQPVTIWLGNSSTPCGGYRIYVERAQEQDTLGCYAASCVLSAKLLDSGEKHV